MENREFYQPTVPEFPVVPSPKITITQLSPETSVQTWPPGYKSGDQIITHTFYEEVYLLDGSITDLTLQQSFGKGYHAWRNPGMEHGPYLADEHVGCQMLVIVRNSTCRDDISSSRN